MRYLVVLVLTLCVSVSSALAQVSVGIALPGVSIGINLPFYPQLVPVPGYPVYYAPYLNSNYFFYDGMYWVFWGDNWYASSWYNGPWRLVAPQWVPLYVLRIPVRYYRAPPAYFRGWSSNAPPRWGQRWGGEWEQQHRGWDQWNRHAAPALAPLPSYQRQYAGERYPNQLERQHELRNQNYRYQPRDPEVRQHYQVPPPSQYGAAPAPQYSGPPAQEQRPQPRPGPPQREPGPRGDMPQQGKGGPHEARHGQPP